MRRNTNNLSTVSSLRAEIWRRTFFIRIGSGTCRERESQLMQRLKNQEIITLSINTSRRNHRKSSEVKFCVLLTVHLDVILVNDQLDSLFLNVFISTPLRVSSSKCSSSGGPTCIIHHLVKHSLEVRESKITNVCFKIGYK